MATIPKRAEEFTAAWLSEVLDEGGHLGEHRIKSAVSHDSDVPGQTAEIAMIAVEYEREDCPLPRSFVGKYASRNQDLVASIIAVYQLYWREYSFYTEFPEVGIPVPTCYHAAFDPATQDFVLLMEDLAPAASPSWASTPEQVAAAASHLPAFHAKWWNDDLLRSKEWLVQFDDLEYHRGAAFAAVASLPRIDELFGSDADATKRVLELWQSKVDDGLDFLADRPFTLVHGDYHPKQLFFPTSAGGRFAVIDWQFSFVSPGAWDLIRIMTLGQDAESRRATQDQMIDGYYAGLLEHGVTDYSKETLLDDIRLGIAATQVIMGIGLIGTDISILERECAALGLDWRDVNTLRGEAAVQDFGVVEFMESL